MKNQPSLANVLESLNNPALHPTPHLLKNLSGLWGNDLAQFLQTWEQLPDARRAEVAKALADLWESTDDVSFEEIGQHLLKDAHPAVRQSAIALLNETEYNPSLLTTYLNLLEKDPSADVRFAVATNLQDLMYKYSLDELPQAQGQRMESILLNAYTNDNSTHVRLRILRVLGYSQRKEIPSLIQAAYTSDNEQKRLNSLYAMAYSGENKRWEKQVLTSLRSPESGDELEAAAYACGELRLSEAIPVISEFLEESEPESFPMLLWALGEIGGKAAKEALVAIQALYADDETMQQLVQDALDSADLQDGILNFGLMDLEDVLNGELDKLEDLGDDLDE
ncbi:MAG TPA: hypothetical protein PK299_05630 [Anaerolineales bacterium]|nr:hypothetical protein [Anaerolineales bacterium]